MDPHRAAQIIGEHFEANEVERRWIEKVIRWVLPRVDDDTTPSVNGTLPGFLPPSPEAAKKKAT
jgi:hypothetical protein